MPEAAEHGKPEEELRALLGAELAEPVPEPVRALAEVLCQRHGRAVRAVLFYGSCLRRNSTDGVLDFYVLVDGYARAQPSRLAAALGWLLPPNVFYLERIIGGRTLRAKVALVSAAHFRRATRPGSLDARIWSRFCQPARLVFARDSAAREEVLAAVHQAVLSAVEWMAIWLPGTPSHRLPPALLWTWGFQQTYRAELRGEKPETIRSLYASWAARFDAVARCALAELQAHGRLRWAPANGDLQLWLDPRRWARARRQWRWRRPLAKARATLGLLKTPLTFPEWLPYALWKLERHSGVRIQLSERQARHPLLLGAPVVLRLLRRRILR